MMTNFPGPALMSGGRITIDLQKILHILLIFYRCGKGLKSAFFISSSKLTRLAMVNGITSGIQISPVQYTCFDGAKKKPL